MLFIAIIKRVKVCVNNERLLISIKTLVRFVFKNILLQKKIFKTMIYLFKQTKTTHTKTELHNFILSHNKLENY